MKYTWKPPVIAQGDQQVDFYDHRGNHCVGECMRVVTHYDGARHAYHIYEMRAHGRKNRSHIGEQNLVAAGVKNKA